MIPVRKVLPAHVRLQNETLEVQSSHASFMRLVKDAKPIQDHFGHDTVAGVSPEIQALRDQIESGTYLDRRKLDITADRLLDDLL